MTTLLFVTKSVFSHIVTFLKNGASVKENDGHYINEEKGRKRKGIDINIKLEMDVRARQRSAKCPI